MRRSPFDEDNKEFAVAAAARPTMVGKVATNLVHTKRGDGLVEFALILPVLMLITMAILDLGRAVYAYTVVANCAREGARAGIIAESSIATAVQAAAIGLDFTQLDVDVTHPTDSTIKVDVSYTFRLITPLLAQVVGGSSLVLRSAATMYQGY